MLRTTAQVAVILALALEGLVYGQTPGIGYLVFWLVSVGATFNLNRTAERPGLPSSWMFLPSLMFAISLFCYDATVVKVWGSLLGLTTLLWAVSWNLIKSREPGALAQLFPKFTLHLGRLVRETSEAWRPLLTPSPDDRRPWGSIVKGILLAIPMVLVFGYLLSSADMVFAKTLEAMQRQLGDVSLALPLRLLLWLAILSAWLRLWLTAPVAEAPSVRSLIGPVELSVALGAVNVLLFSFLLIQIRFLFGDAQLVESLGISYADYARKGFFELTACIALILPLVMVAYQTAQTNSESRLHWLGGALVAQAVGLAISAFRRMLLYIDTFGLSVERFYAATGILVAITVLAWAAYACLRPQQVSWVLGRQIVTVFFLLGMLALVNVEKTVTVYNIERSMSADKDLDLEYLSTMSCDVLPTLEQHLSHLSPWEQTQVRQTITFLQQQRSANLGVSWNLSRDRAARIQLLPQAQTATNASVQKT